MSRMCRSPSLVGINSTPRNTRHKHKALTHPQHTLHLHLYYYRFILAKFEVFFFFSD